MEFLCGLVVALVFVTLVGHGLWALAAAVFRALTGAPDPHRPPPRWRACPDCGRDLQPGERECRKCGLDQSSRLAGRLAHLRYAIHEVDALAGRGALDAETAERVVAQLRDRLRELAGRPAPRPAAAEPVAPPLARPLDSVPPLPAESEEIPTATVAPPEYEVVEASAEPAPPRRGTFAGFMESRNILWGELVGGLLIVGCSIALVLSLWRRLEELPYFPFLLAASITAALFGAGQYTLHHWKLAATSRGLLVIALLLAPLNLLLLAAPGVAREGPLDLGVKLAALLGFVGLVRAAGRDLIGTALLPGPIDRRWLLALAAVGPPAVLWLPGADAAGGWPPLACHALACGAVLAGLTWYRRGAADEPIEEQGGWAVLVFVGVSGFALLAAWGLLLTRAPDLPAAVRGLAVPLVVGAVPVLLGGLLVQRRLVPGYGGLAATATGAAVAAAGLIATGVTLAWPDPLRLTAAAAIAGAVLTRVAWRERLPWFQLGAVPALGLAAVLAVAGLAGRWDVPEGVSADWWAARLLTSSTAGVTLTGLALILAAIAELAVRRGARDQAIGAALGAVGVAAAGLLLVTGHGLNQPWTAAGAHAAAAVGLLAANARWRRRVVALAGVWAALVASLWTLWAAEPPNPGVWSLTVALEALALAGAALALTPLAARPGPGGVAFGQLRVASRDVAVAAAVLAVVMVANSSWGLPLHAGAFLALAPTGLLLARVANRRVFTWAGSAAAAVGLAHLAYYTLDRRPGSAALLTAFLAHATLALLLAAVLGGRRSRERLFAAPLRATARVSAALAVPLLLIPAAGQAPEWAGAAAWLAAVFFALAWRREAGAFSAGQAALAAAAVLAALGWAERQEWWHETRLGAADPRALRAAGVALALLGLAWAAARRLARPVERLRALWLRDPFAVDRLVVGGVVVLQLVLLSFAVIPGLHAELTPRGYAAWAAPAELAHAFEPAAWLVPALLAVVLVAKLRVRTDDEPPGDAALVGLVALLLTAPVLAAGAVAPQLAAASALRWGLAAAFLAGSAAVFARKPLAAAAGRLGFHTGATVQAAVGAYTLLALAAAVVVLLTAHVAELGLHHRTPTGPADDTVFARLGWTLSYVVPMALVAVGLTGTAVRERLAGYATAAGGVVTFTLAAGYALAVVTGGRDLGAVDELRVALLALAGVAGWAALWVAAGRRAPRGVLLDLQAAAGMVVVALLAVVPLARLFAHPGRPLDPANVEIGRYGWPLLAVAAWAAFARAGRVAPRLRAHVLGLAGLVAGVLAGCAAVPWDAPDAWVSFHVLAAAWAAVGLGFAAAQVRTMGPAPGGWLVAVATGLALAAVRGPAPGVGEWVAPVALAGFALAAVGLVVFLTWTAIEEDRGKPLLAGLIVTAAAAGLLAVLAAVADAPVAARLGGPGAVLVLAVAAGLLAARAPGRWVEGLRVAAVLLAAGGVALAGWAGADPDGPAVWLRRNGWALVGLVAAAAAALGVAARLANGWAVAARRGGGAVAAVSLAALAVVLLQQIPAFDPATRRTPLGLPATLAVLAAVAAQVALALLAALRPAADPLGLPENRRTGYVYLAEVLFVLLFLHVRLNLPELFLGQLARYWTFVVMLLAFAWVGAAELFERRGLRVLAGPIRRTGVLLPLVPLLAFWAKPPGFVLAFADDAAPGLRPLLGYLERLPQHFDAYAGLWTLTGLLYGLIAVRRRSFRWALVAALAANAGLWSVLAHTGVPAVVHPQVWVIPLALTVLVSEHVNRRRLQPGLTAGLRYAGIGMLYLASAADMFIAGVGESLWLPVVLAVFCVAGILAGIMLRVRAFLFLGAGFLLLDVFAMIWHAAVGRGQTWVWYAAGIVLGAAILALFAVFEKRKNEVRGVVEELRRWD